MRKEETLFFLYIISVHECCQNSDSANILAKDHFSISSQLTGYIFSRYLRHPTRPLGPPFMMENGKEIRVMGGEWESLEVVRQGERHWDIETGDVSYSEISGESCVQMNAIRLLLRKNKDRLIMRSDVQTIQKDWHTPWEWSLANFVCIRFGNSFLSADIFSVVLKKRSRKSIPQPLQVFWLFSETHSNANRKMSKRVELDHLSSTFYNKQNTYQSNRKLIPPERATQVDPDAWRVLPAWTHPGSVWPGFERIILWISLLGQQRKFKSNSDRRATFRVPLSSGWAGMKIQLADS